LKNVQRGLGLITAVECFGARTAIWTALWIAIWTAASTHSIAQTSDARQIAAASPPSSASDTACLDAALPDAPEPMPPAQTGSSSPVQARVYQPRVPRKYALMIEPGQKAQHLSVPDKFVYSLLDASRPITLVPALYSASYEQITGADPKYGSDGGAFAAHFGAAMAHSVSTRVFADGLFASAFHQDPRYYRVAKGSIMYRSLHSALEVLIRRGDDGAEQFNYSGILGRGASAGLVLAYYPPKSQRTGVVFSTWAVSIGSDAIGNVMLEFLPDLARKFPILNKFRVE
jgi:hypothetical protein